MKNWFERFFGKNEKPQNLAFTPDELELMAKVWAAYGHQNIQKLSDRLVVHITSTSQLQVHKHRITFHGERDHEAFKAALHHAQQAWGGFHAHGSDEFKLKSWAYAQAYGVTMFGYAPPEHSADEAAKLVAQIKALRMAETGTTRLEGVSPFAASSAVGAGDTTSVRPAEPQSMQTAPLDSGDPLSPLHRPTEYVPPRNAVVELFNATPKELHGIMREQLEQMKKEIPTDDDWPYSPYHYGMGRIKAYEDWLDGLSEDERKREVAACRARYEEHYQAHADLLVSRMLDLGYELSPRRREREASTPIASEHDGLMTDFVTPQTAAKAEAERPRIRVRDFGHSR